MSDLVRNQISRNLPGLYRLLCYRLIVTHRYKESSLLILLTDVSEQMGTIKNQKYLSFRFIIEKEPYRPEDSLSHFPIYNPLYEQRICLLFF